MIDEPTNSTDEPKKTKATKAAVSTEPANVATTIPNTPTEDTTIPTFASKKPYTISRPKSRDGHYRARPLAAALFLIVTLGLGFAGGWLGAASRGNDDVSSNRSVQKTVLSSQAAVISAIAKDVGQSVVSVNVTGVADTSSTGSFFGGGGGAQTQQSAGTGMILTSTGLIMTNRHVVPTGTTSVSVTLSDGTVYDNVKVVGRTADTDSLDVAFLQIPDTKGKTLVPVTLGDSSKVAVGDTAVAIGNALGQFQNTVTSGIISGYGRSLTAGDSSGTSTENLDDLFQTDAAINEGNSGGPLVNIDGQVIGMNTALATGSQSIGFAIPINDLSGLIDSVKATGKLERPYLGVVYVPITSDIAKEYNLTTDSGAYIPKSSDLGQATIIVGGPADKAGVQEGDVITEVDGTTINESTSLTSALGKHKVGDSVTLTIVRDGKTITKDVTLGAAPTSN